MTRGRRMQEPDIRIKARDPGGANGLGMQKRIAQGQACIDRIARRSAVAGYEPEAGG